MTIYFLGPAGSYSEIAVRKKYGTGNTYIPLHSFEEVTQKTVRDEGSIGALVIENSISSSVHKNVDLLYQNTNIHIIDETFMKIQMDLMSVPSARLDSITDIYSYPQALAQCSDFIKNHTLTPHEAQSTSEAANHILISQDTTKAAIGSRLLAKKHEFKVLQSDIANERHNISRWVFISNAKQGNKKSNKATYIFKVKHEVGSLVAILNKLADANGNLTKIESRPLPGTNWEYGFWVDIEFEEGLQDQFAKIMKKETFECRIVGEYNKGALLI